MSHYDYELSIRISTRDEPFYALLFALMRRADSENLEKIKDTWPIESQEFYERYVSPGGLLEGENDAH